MVQCFYLEVVILKYVAFICNVKLYTCESFGCLCKVKYVYLFEKIKNK